MAIEMIEKIRNDLWHKLWSDSKFYGAGLVLFSDFAK